MTINHDLLDDATSLLPRGGSGQPNLNSGSTLSVNTNNNNNNRLLAYNLITLEDAERKYLDLLDNEKQHYKKKEQASRDII